MLYSDRVPAFKQTIKGVHGSDFNFSELMKHGWIELDKAAVEATAIVTPHVKKGVIYSYFIIADQPSNVLQGRVPDQISGNYNYKMGVSRIKKIGETKYKKEFTRISFAPRNVV
jgi:arsenite oxidase large subunit